MKVEAAAHAAFVLADALEAAGIPYAISGAVALAVHGVPRLTADADLTVDVTPEDLDRVFDALERARLPIEREYARRCVAVARFFKLDCGSVNVDVFVAASRRRVSVVGPDGRARWFSSAEDLAIHKLALLRRKDLADLEQLFAAQGAAMDLGYLRSWVEAVTPDPSDRRRAALDDLVRRFVSRA